MTDVLSVATLLVSVAALLATVLSDDPSLQRLVWVRRGCVGVGALLVAAGVAGLVSSFALRAACLAALLSTYAIWLARCNPGPSLETYLDHLTADADAAWETEFERPFEEYLREQTYGRPSHR